MARSSIGEDGMVGRLHDNAAIVTGSGRWIGEAIARTFHREGAKVLIAEIDEETGGMIASNLSPEAATALFASCDVRDTGSVEAVVETTSKRFGRTDILVNNAGINVFHDPLETSDAEWRCCFDIDLDGVWRMSKAVMPAMLDRGTGSIVNIASAHSSSIIPGCSPCPVAKHGPFGALS